MKFNSFYPAGSGSLGEPRRPRGFMSEEPRIYRVENSRGYSSGPTVLIAEDDDDSRAMMRTLLERKGYYVTEAADGEQAIEVALSERPALILLDLKLAGSDTRRLRQQAKVASVPIILVSGWDLATYEEIALSAGCNECLPKPIDFDRLEAMLNRYVPLPPATNQQPESHS